LSFGGKRIGNKRKFRRERRRLRRIYEEKKKRRRKIECRKRG